MRITLNSFSVQVLVLLFFCFSISSFSQNVTVSGALTGNGSYATLRTAFTAINAASQTSANIMITIDGDTNEGASSAVLNAGAWSSLQIVPVGARTISGATTAGNPLINFNGADNVSINGLNAGGNSLSISNTTVSSSANTATIRFIADATQNTIANCTLSGSELATSSGIIFFSSGTLTGNDNNTISNCVLMAAGTNLPLNAIYSAGLSVSIDNSGNTISSNTIQDYFHPSISSSGILLSNNSSAWTISANRFFQTASRTTTANSILIRAIAINTASAGGYNITNNTIGFANASGTGTMVYNGLASASFRGIELSGNTTTSNIQGNVVAGIDFSTVNGTTGSPGIFSGIVINSGAVNVGTSSGNTIGSASIANSILVTSSSTNTSRIDGIYVNSANATSTIQNNSIGGITTGGAFDSGYSLVGIYSNGTSGNFTITNNTIGSATVANSIALGTEGVTTTGVCNFNGIYNNATSLVTVANNTIQNNSVYGTAASSFYGINTVSGSSVAVNSNSISDNTLTGTNNFLGIYNTAASSSLAINNNILKNFNLSNASTSFSAIRNSGAVTTTIDINNNQLGNASGGLVNLTAAITPNFFGIYNTQGTATAALTIQGNDIRGITHSVTGSSSHYYVYNSAATLSQNISNNTFTNLSVNTTGNVTFIGNSVALTASGSQVISGNSIVGSFAKTASGGAVTVFNTNATSNASGVITNSNNDFSNITVLGTTTTVGWGQRDFGTTFKTITNNIFRNWSTGTGTITVMTLDGFGNSSSVSNNTIEAITGQGSVTGIVIGTSGNAAALSVANNSITSLSSSGTGGNVLGLICSNNATIVNINTNAINALTSSGASSTVTGIQVSGGNGTTNVYSNILKAITESGATNPNINGILISNGTTSNVYKNKIYDLSQNGASTGGGVNGIIIAGGTAVSVYNNLIADLKAPTVSNNHAIRGIIINSSTSSSSYKLYYNTVYLNASSSGTNFGSDGIYHTTNTVATTANLILNNNIVINKSVANGSGRTAAYYRNNATLTNYDLGSNYNLFYAGIPSASNLIYNDNTNRDQSLTSFQNRVSTREVNSVTEDVVFLSTVGTHPDFLRPNITLATQIESAGSTIAGITNDYEGTTRQGNLGYSGLGTAPDLGAYEIAGLEPASSSSVAVSGALFGNGDYLSLGSAFAAINGGSQTGANIIIAVNIDTDEGNSTAILNAGTWNSILIRPSGNRTITGNTTPGSALINLNGADNVTLNGLNTGGNSLSISNTTVSATAGTATIRFIKDATNNSIQNCTISGSETLASSGTIAFSTGITTGNDNNTISNCIITSAGANLPTNAIYSAGTSISIDNSGNTISNNKIQDYFNPIVSSNGIYVASNSAAWTISGNKLFQTATRTSAVNAIYHRGIYINTVSAGGYVISANTIGFANAAGTGATIYDGNFTAYLRGIDINANTTVSSIQGNLIAGINFSTSNGIGYSPGIFSGINVSAGAVNIGTVTGNTIGSTTGNNAIVVTSSSTTNSNRIDGIYAVSASTTSKIQNNKIGGIGTGGVAAAGYSIVAISSGGSLGNFTISNNTIGSTSTANSITAGTNGLTTTGACSIFGIVNNATGAISITNNTISNGSVYGDAGSSFYGIYNNLGSTVAINSNTISDATLTGTGVMRVIYNGAAASTLAINSNAIKNCTLSSASTAPSFIGIQNSGAVTASINIDNNLLGDASGSLINYTTANSANLFGINNSNGNTAATLSIQSNNIRGIVHSVAGSSPHYYIYNTAPTLSQNISSNTFTNLSVNTTGSVTFISNNVALSASGSQIVSGNSIVGSFSKTGTSGAVTGFTTGATSASGAIITNSNNNFSNITVTGTTGITGWNQQDLGLTTKTITNNTFSNWTAGTGVITAIYANGFGGASTLSTNNISTLTGQAAITGITINSTGNANTLAVTGNSFRTFSSTGTGGTVLGLGINNNSTNIYINSNTLNSLSTSGTSSTVSGIQLSGGTGAIHIYSNVINTLFGTGVSSPTANGIYVTGGATVNVYKNKIYGISENGVSTGGTVNGMNITGGTNFTAHNNLIGDLKAPLTSNTLAVRGILVNSAVASSTYKVYYNTVYINATSTAANFGTTGIYHVTNTTATTASLDLKNNIIVNNSTPRGSGRTVAYYRSNATFTNYGSTSNNNLFYAGTPGASNLIFYNGANSDQTLAAFQTRVSPREAVSVTENPPFTSTNGSDATFLHFAEGTASFAESNGQIIAGLTTDFDGDSRNGSTPDLGADEFAQFSPTISSFSPTDFCVSIINQTVTITGLHLNMVTSVTFQGPSGRLTATITSQTANSISVTTPAGFIEGTIILVYSGGSVTSNPYTVSPLSIGGTLSSNQTICYGSQPSDLNLSGNTGSVQKWQRASNAAFTTSLIDIANVTTTLTGAAIGNLSGTTYFRAIVQSGDCSSSNSSYATITVGASTTWNGSVWSNGVPTSAIAAIISGNYSSSGDFSACTLTVNNNAAVTVNSGHDFYISNSVIVSAGSALTFENNANLIQNGSINSNSGNIKVRRNSSSLKRLDYTLWSSPVENQNVLAFSPSTIASRFYTYNSTTNLYNVIAPLANIFATAKGYLIRMPDSHPTTATTWTGAFEGIPNNGDYSYVLSNSGAGFRYNLIGNPYPSPISSDDFISNNTSNTSGTLYFWRKTNASLNSAYCTLNLLGFQTNSDSQTVDPNYTIQTGQGFFVEASDGATSVSFTNAMRTGNNSGQFFRNANTNIEKNRIWLNVTNNTGAFSQTLLGYMTNATQGIDNAIDGKNIEDGEIALTSLINNASFSIQGRSLPFDPADVVPLSFKATNAGSFRIAIDHVDGLFSSNQEVLLKDNLTNTIHNLTTSGYDFASESGLFNTRFEIVYQNPLTVSQAVFNVNSVIVYKQNQELVINTGKIKMANVKIFDIRGRLLVEKKNVNSPETRLFTGINNEVLIVQITSDSEGIVTKKVVN